MSGNTANGSLTRPIDTDTVLIFICHERLTRVEQRLTRIEQHLGLNGGTHDGTTEPAPATEPENEVPNGC